MKDIKDNVKTLAISIGNTSYQFTKGTVNKIEIALQHIEKNKKLYRCFVFYLGLCLMPQFINIGKGLIYEFLYMLSLVPKDMYLEFLQSAMLELAKVGVLALMLYEILMTAIKEVWDFLLKL